MTDLFVGAYEPGNLWPSKKGKKWVLTIFNRSLLTNLAKAKFLSNRSIYKFVLVEKASLFFMLTYISATAASVAKVFAAVHYGIRSAQLMWTYHTSITQFDMPTPSLGQPKTPRRTPTIRCFVCFKIRKLVNVWVYQNIPAHNIPFLFCLCEFHM